MNKKGINITIASLLILGLMYLAYLMLPSLLSMTFNIVSLAGMLLIVGVVIYILIQLLTSK